MIDTLAELFAMRGVPNCIRSDNGPDILIGGRDLDEMRGQSGSDMLIAEQATLEESRLDQLYAEWTANQSRQNTSIVRLRCCAVGSLTMV